MALRFDKFFRVTHFEPRFFHNNTLHNPLNVQLLNSETERTEFALHTILTMELILNTATIAFSASLVVNGVKKEREWPLFNFLVCIIAFFFLSLGIMNVKLLLGAISTEILCFEAMVLIIYLYFIFIVFQAYTQVWDECKQGGSTISTNSFRRDLSTLSGFEGDNDPIGTRAI
ncbi:unnamed protein product [Orchesella dallaii]|uniref:MARVEL domain-containing protein n=1 Tax=Orchesella dallaii TaxID=48710 RepID=A0ABP1RGH4_9HEXA